jgi:hypothetical protein
MATEREKEFDDYLRVRALLMLREWDMLTIWPDGHGTCADAPWARSLIDRALGPRYDGMNVSAFDAAITELHARA